MDLGLLISQIQSVDGALKHEASKAVNRLLTIRNWLIGYYIVEYEQKGEDRARYGAGLLNVLADELNIKGLSFTALKLNRLFYISYPQIIDVVPQQFIFKNSSNQIGQTLSDQFTLENNVNQISQTLSDQFILDNDGNQIEQTLSAQFKEEKISMQSADLSPEAQLATKIVEKLSFSHITLLLSVDDALKRAYYAIEAIKGTWSVRELKRQINSLLFERSGISKKPEQLLQTLNVAADKHTHPPFVKDIYTFEFLGLPVKNAVEETDLETALLDNLQEFLLEMGHGFCLEARQKRILIGDEYFFIDLVFYHRILKCHVLVDLKIEEFSHNNAGQLNTYINYYKKEVMLQGDNPPIGILLVTNKNNALVEYATAGMDEKLFVRQYMLELPDKKQIEAFINKELQSL